MPRFQRLAGTPILRRDRGRTHPAKSALTEAAPGGFHSPTLHPARATAVDFDDGKPESDQARVMADGDVF